LGGFKRSPNSKKKDHLAGREDDLGVGGEKEEAG